MGDGEIDAAPDEPAQCSRYQKLHVIGRGAVKTVYKAFDEREGMEVALNVIHVSENGRECTNARSRLFSEIQVLQSLSHKNIMRLFDWWYDPRKQTLNFITELFTHGSLRHYKSKHPHADERVLKRWAWQILQGLVYLHGHEPPIIHRDLKCDNIFINGSSGQVKIGDLGFATVQRRMAAPQTVIGTPEFMAPELYDETYDAKVDVYSFGLCLLELATLEYPYSECRNPAQIYKKVSQGLLPDGLAKVTSTTLRTFISECIRHDPQQRPSARSLLKHPYFDSIRMELDLHCCLSRGITPAASGAATPNKRSGGVTPSRQSGTATPVISPIRLPRGSSSNDLLAADGVANGNSGASGVGQSPEVEIGEGRLLGASMAERKLLNASTVDSSLLGISVGSGCLLGGSALEREFLSASAASSHLPAASVEDGRLLGASSLAPQPLGAMTSSVADECLATAASLSLTQELSFTPPMDISIAPSMSDVSAFDADPAVLTMTEAVTANNRPSPESSPTARLAQLLPAGSPLSIRGGIPGTSSSNPNSTRASAVSSVRGSAVCSARTSAQGTSASGLSSAFYSGISGSFAPSTRGVSMESDLNEGDVLFEQGLPEGGRLSDAGGGGRLSDVGEGRMGDTFPPRASAAKSVPTIQERDDLLLTCRMSDIRQLSVNLKFCNGKGAWKHVGFAYDLEEDTVDQVSREMLEALSMCDSQAVMVATKLKAELARLQQQAGADVATSRDL